MCDRCGKKTESIKGLRLDTLPDVLLLQLKRFDFDYTTLQRVKLNDYVSFPLWLDMNPYTATKPAAGDTAAAGGGVTGDAPVAAAGAAAPTPAETAAPADEVSPAAATAAAPAPAPASASAAVSSAIPEDMAPEDMLAKFGPNVYELYAVLVHSGGALGGHYYAYIKNMDSGLWYNFNDASVTAITVPDVKMAFGGSSTSAGGYSYSSSANAYMLLYRWGAVVATPALPLPPRARPLPFAGGGRPRRLAARCPTTPRCPRM